MNSISLGGATKDTCLGQHCWSFAGRVAAELSNRTRTRAARRWLFCEPQTWDLFRRCVHVLRSRSGVSDCYQLCSPGLASVLAGERECTSVWHLRTHFCHNFLDRVVHASHCLWLGVDLWIFQCGGHRDGIQTAQHSFVLLMNYMGLAPNSFSEEEGKYAHWLTHFHM